MPSLDILVLVDRDHVAAWQAASIDHALALPGTRLAAVVRLTRDDAGGDPGTIPPLLERYRRQDLAKHAPPDGLDPLQPVALDELTLRLPDGGSISQARDESELRRIVESLVPDVLLDLGAGAAMRSLSGLPRRGHWRYGFDDGTAAGAEPLGLREVAAAAPTIVTELRRLGATADDDRVLVRSVGATNRFSVRKTQNEQLWKAATFAARAARHTLDDARAAAPVAPAPDGSGWSPARGPVHAAAFLTRLYGRRLRNRVRESLYEEQWMMAYRLAGRTAASETLEPTASIERVLRDGATGFRVMLPPKDRYWADPFPFLRDGRYHLFFEEVLRSDDKGRIAVVEIHADGTHGEPRTVLERPYHLSYPFVFEWEGETWMIPESSASRTVELYRATAYPYEWTFDRVLLDDVAGCDATVFEAGDRWWMALTIEPELSRAYWDELHLFHGPTPLGPWTAHHHAPVKSDVRSARPAGRVVREGGALLRPAQDCSRGYGWSIVLNRIEELSETTFIEREVGRLLPTWHRGLVGTHTINAAGRLVAIDGNLRRARHW